MEQARLPEHIAIIMDGNGRWAASRGLPRILGHRAGAEAVHRIVGDACDVGLRFLTLYAFSWENWKRPEQEVRDLMELLDEFIRRETPMMLERRVRLRILGRLDQLPKGTARSLRNTMELTRDCEGLTLNLALSYGGRQEILDAVLNLARAVRAGELDPAAITEETISGNLYTAGMPDPDLVIRTSGEQRLSNFLLWQSSYSEWVISPKYWPDFTKEDLLEAIRDFSRRDRRFGRTGSENGSARDPLPLDILQSPPLGD